MKESYSYSDQEYTVGGNGTVVDAIYRKAKSPIDIGNRYIEALPYPLIDIQEKLPTPDPVPDNLLC